MIRKLLAPIGVLALLLVVASPTQAATVAEVTARMDEIIKEMLALRVEFNELAGQVSAGGGTAETGNVLGASNSSRLTETIAFGETNDDIKLIQKLLATDPEIYAYGAATGFFGPKTQEAIRNLQRRFNLDPVGVVGPATTLLLEAFLAKYPGDTFPADALDSDPRVQGVSTSQSTAPAPAPTTNTTSINTGSIKSITAEMDRGEAKVTIYYVNGNKKKYTVTGDNKEETIKAIVERASLSEAVVRATLVYSEEAEDNDDEDYDEGDAEDAIEDADDEIDEVQDKIDEADEDGDDIDWAEDTLDDAIELLEEAEDAYDDEDYDEAVDKAKDAKELAKEAEDRIDEEKGGRQGDADEIKRIKVDVEEDESEVTVQYEDDDDYEFTVDEDKEDEIIEAIADELDIDEDDVEDLISLDYGDVDEINVLVEDGDAEVTVEYESGATRRFTIDEDDEDEMIEDIADEIDEDEDDVEDWTDFDYN